MEIIKIHYKISKPVGSYKEIKKEAEAMRRFIILGNFKGFYNKAFAIAHCQVSETPYAFFVVAPECVKEKMFEDDVIINPQIIEARPTKEIRPKKLTMTEGEVLSIPNIVEYQEPCMSFPFRTPKRVNRYDVISVRYQIPGFLRLKTIHTTLSGIASEIFQHEFDHLGGRNIYFQSETPVRWWELIGTPKSKGGTSLDSPEELGLKRAEEKETVVLDIKTSESFDYLNHGCSFIISEDDPNFGRCIICGKEANEEELKVIKENGRSYKKTSN